MTKESLREEVRAMLRDRNPTEEESRAVSEKLLALEELKRARTVLAFEPMLKSEPDIRPVLRQAGGFFRKVYVPELVSESEMVFVPRGSLMGGRFIGAGDSLPQPVVVIVPGLAFSEDGRRLGRGRGYYDRFLGKMRGCGTEFTAVGVCTGRQLRDEIPVEEHDVKVDIVVTDGKVYGGNSELHRK